MLGDLQKYILEKNKAIIKTDDDGNKYILEEDIQNIDGNSEERRITLLCFKLSGIAVIPKKITKEDRSPLVRDFDYGSVKGNNLESLDKPVKAEIEYHGEAKVFENYEELDKYILNEFIPANVRMKVNNGPVVNGEKRTHYPSIQLNAIVKLRLSEEEIDHVIGLLDSEGIRIGGVSPDLAGEFGNYDYVLTHASKKYLDPLPKAVQEQKFLEYYETKDPVLCDELVNRNLRLIEYVAWKWARRYEVDVNSLLGYGYEGLLRAVKKHNPYLGGAFSTFAYICISSAIHGGLTLEKRFPSPNNYYNFERAKAVVEEAWGKKFDNSDEMFNEILELMEAGYNVSPVAIAKIRQDYYNRSIEALDKTYDIQSKADFENDVLSGLLSNEISKALARLPDRERKVIILRFGLADGKPMSLEDIGKQLGVTKERIRQIEGRALRILRHPSFSKYLKPYLDVDFNDFESSGEISSYNEAHRISESDYMNQVSDEDPSLSDEVSIFDSEFEQIDKGKKQ